MNHLTRRLPMLLLLPLVLLVGGGSLIAPSALGEGAKKGKEKPAAKGGGSTPEGLVNKLFGPGPLIDGHKDLEHGDCLQCHDAGQGVPDAKCLACHKDIRQSIKEGDSFHALQQSKSCIKCHTDHKGRNFDSTIVNTKTFEHSRTGFKLQGAHAKLNCLKCHEKDTYFGLDDTCKECHKKDDPHDFPGKLAAKDCGACHSESSWKKGATFDHLKETGYALVGDHATLTCEKCHKPGAGGKVKYQFPELKSEKCLACHADHHKSGLSAKFQGGACDRCHGQTDWRIKNFVHDITGFVLRGEHARLACVDCHTQAPGVRLLKDFKWKGEETSCASCHADYHGFAGESSSRLGPLSNCDKCHSDVGWKKSLDFDHNRDTSYPINGKHVGLKCFRCHTPKSGGAVKSTPRIYEFPQLESKTCETCHKSPHTNDSSPVFRNNKCSSCHVTSGWQTFASDGSFNHSTMTRFPLAGDHAGLRCAQCHIKDRGGKKQVYKFANADKQFCVSCHKSPHPGQFHDKFLTTSCATCHDSVDFRNQSGFNHNLSRFVLTGEHKNIAAQCTKCHVKTTKKLATRPPKAAGRFIFEHAKTGFCIDCHKNVHKDQFSERFPATDCRSCHNTTSFKNLLTFDHNKTRFRLTGDHARLKNQCVKCHVPTKQLLASNPPRPAGRFKFPGESRGYCDACHKNVHVEQFDKKFAEKPCLECHNTTDFGKRKAFDHDTTAFDLTGAHAKIANDCNQCHKKTDKLLPTKPPKKASQFMFAHQSTSFCEACHTNEHKGQFHQKFAEAPCKDCHSTVAFDAKWRFDHGRAAFDVKGEHLKLKCAECHTKTDARFKVSPHHKKGKFQFPELDSKDCALCHKDPHAGSFGKRCSECHTDKGWDATADFHRDFLLSGVHYTLDCTDCHEGQRRLSGTGTECRLCHMKDDPHQGQQPECASCHNQLFWEATRFQHSLTDFPLRGSHRMAECIECHAQGVYQGQVTECRGCHYEDAVNAKLFDHTQFLNDDCQRCHLNTFRFEGAVPR